MAKTKIKAYSLSEMKDEVIRKIGASERDKYESVKYGNSWKND